MTETLRGARARYWAENAFGADGGDAEPWVYFKMGNTRFPVPNSNARRAAVKIHDVHHILTGYQTDWRSELEIALFELGTGCGRAWFAWFINLAAAPFVLFLLPRRGLRAFAFGRRSRGLYRSSVDALLDRTVDELRAERLPAERPKPGLADGLFFLGMVVVALPLSVLQLSMILLTMPILRFVGPRQEAAS